MKNSMTFSEIREKAGPLTAYLPYFLLVFLWYFLDNLYTAIKPINPESSIEPLLEWGFAIVIVPMIMAGLFGGIHERQQDQEVSTIGSFFRGIKKHYWRILAADLLMLVFYLVVSIALAVAGVVSLESEQTPPLVALINGIISVTTLFWFTAIVVERKLFPSFFSAVKTFSFIPSALVIGIGWGVLVTVDMLFFDTAEVQGSLLLNGAWSAVFAAVRILAAAFLLAIYKQARGEEPAESPKEVLLPESSTTSVGDGWGRASIGFTFIAFVPLMGLVALILGIVALRRKKRFAIGPAIACCVGGFFTLFYFLIIAGWIATPPSLNAPGYAFLAEANADLKQQVALLEQGAVQDIQSQLDQNTTKDPEQDWTLDAILAVAKYNDGDLDGALEAFHIAAEKRPERSEFYYYYGLTLLDNGQTEMAAGQFQNALEHEPPLEAAEQYLHLIRTAYQPSAIASALLMVVVLLILFTVHEYGHAFAAWKLGDDTAKNLGRLTLNPVPHLDLFGSIILPGLLLWQQAGVVFGWAKPVPVNPENFQNPKKDHMRVAFAGPAVNFIVALVCFVVLGFLMLFVRMVWPGTLALNLADPFSPVSIVGPPMTQWLVFAVVFLRQMLYTSLVLGFFNLLPIPPLDGSWILSGFLPQKMDVLFEKMRKFGFVIFILLAVTPVFDYLLTIPVIVAVMGLQIIFSAMGLG
jgi:Zn-dependent protease